MYKICSARIFSLINPRTHRAEVIVLRHNHVDHSRNALLILAFPNIYSLLQLSHLLGSSWQNSRRYFKCIYIIGCKNFEQHGDGWKSLKNFDCLLHMYWTWNVKCILSLIHDQVSNWCYECNILWYKFNTSNNWM